MALEGLGLDQEALDEILDLYKDDLMSRAITVIALGELQPETHEGTEDFVLGDAIRLLPAHCQVRVDPNSSSSVPDYYPGFSTLPVWENIVGPHTSVGMVHRDIPIPTKRQRSHALEEPPDTIPVGTELYIRPRVTKPFFDFFANGLAISPDSIKGNNFHINPRYADPKVLNRTALMLLRERKEIFDRRAENEWTEHIRDWRCKRRQWELTLLENEWIHKEQSRILPLGFGIDNLVDARRHIEIANAMEREGLISPFEIGLRDREKTQPYDEVIKEMADLEAAIKQLEELLNN